MLGLRMTIGIITAFTAAEKGQAAKGVVYISSGVVGLWVIA